VHHDIRMTEAKIFERLALIAPLAYRRLELLEPLRYKPLPDTQLDPALLDPRLDTSTWQAIPPYAYWGSRNTNFVMRGEFAIPADFGNDLPVELYLPLGDAGDFSHPEALAYIDGKPYAATDRHHQGFRLPRAYLSGTHTLTLHGWTGLLTGRSDSVKLIPGEQLQMRECGVAQVDPPTRELIATARVALETSHFLDDFEPAKTRLLNALDDAFKLLDTREPIGDAFYASVSGALAALRRGIDAAGAPLDAEVIAAGHAHIDTAWLWTLGQTRQKSARTFHTVMLLMEQFPDYHFSQSQPQLYDFIRQDFPALFDDIKRRVKEGRWEPMGGMWVEADCNISGPESLARQFLLGRSFFREHFGPEAETPVLWLPDVFGYSWSLPQLIKLAGLEYFFTIKIGWNQVNRMPYDSFWWQGVDGTKILTHFSTSPGLPWLPGEPPSLLNNATYNSELAPFGILGSWASLKHKEAQRVMLMAYGYGDGGGGPTREMSENAAVMTEFPALPRVKQGTVREFFRTLEQESGDKLPTWNGELYLEIHRGTYTTQSRNKRANRKSEFLLHDAEFLATLAALLDPDYQYPAADLRKGWELVCLNQFHDIIPGSSVHDVYDESLEQYAVVQALAQAAAADALVVVQAKAGGDVVIVNPTGFRRDDLAFWQGELPAGRGLADAATQRVEGGTLIACGELAPFEVRSLRLAEAAEPAPASLLVAEPGRLENAYLRVELNQAGDITRVYDKMAGREVLPPGGIAAQFQAFEDRPIRWDAWDIDIFYDDKLFLAEPAESIRVVEAGPLRATIEIRRRILNSAYTQRISLAYNQPQLDFDTAIDWQERHILLKAAFPADVLSPVATYEIQWGSVQRPTHRNTSWDWARFESAAQKWVDLSEGNYGISLLNDSKYGHDIRDNVVRVSLLRGTTYPDPLADLGQHRFAYSLFPHANSGTARVTNGEIARRAYAFNDPLIVSASAQAAGGSGQAPALVSLPANIVVETVKWAEDGNGMIVRFYECNRERGPVTLHAGFPLKSAAICNLLEEDQEALEVEGQDVKLFVKPFQIVTVRLVSA
jgi:alpha-mannosidase